MWRATRDRRCGCVSNGALPSQSVLSGSRCHHSVPSTNGTWVNHRRSSGDLSGENPRRVGRGSGLCLQKRWNAIARCGRARRAERPLQPAQAGASETPRMAIRDVSSSVESATRPRSDPRRASMFEPQGTAQVDACSANEGFRVDRREATPKGGFDRTSEVRTAHCRRRKMATGKWDAETEAERIAVKRPFPGMPDDRKVVWHTCRD